MREPEATFTEAEQERVRYLCMALTAILSGESGPVIMGALLMTVGNFMASADMDEKATGGDRLFAVDALAADLKRIIPEIVAANAEILAEADAKHHSLNDFMS